MKEPQFNMFDIFPTDLIKLFNGHVRLIFGIFPGLEATSDEGLGVDSSKFSIKFPFRASYKITPKVT